MPQVPYPDDVVSADSFAAFVVALRASLDHALTIPLTSPYAYDRGGWTNWTLASFIDGMANWIRAVHRLPLARDSQTIWTVLFPVSGIWNGGSDELRQYLDDVAAWAASTTASSLDEPWHEAAEAMAAGAVFE
jgi:hypothetical protein